MKILIFNKVCLKSYIKSQSIICLVIIFQPWCILATNQSRLLHIYECSTVVSMWLTVWCYLVNLYNLAIFVSCARVFFVVFLSVNFHINPDLFPLRFPFFPTIETLWMGFRMQQTVDSNLKRWLQRLFWKMGMILV